MKSFISFENLRKRFPQVAFMDQRGESYLDSASTSLKMDLVWMVLREFYEKEVSNVHRGEHHLSLKATERYEKARDAVANFLGAEHSSEIIFTRSSTEGLNFLAEALSGYLSSGDEILVTEMEHHSNFLPWQALAEKKGLRFKVVPVDSEGGLDMKQLEKLLTPKVKIVSITQVSNVTGVINPLKKIISLARKTKAFVIVDSAQSVSFLSVDVKKMDCDFLVFSGHKIFAPSGIGVLYGKRGILEKLPPYQKGGGMITKVSVDKSDWAEAPYKFEAGTPFIEGALALAEVLSFLKNEVDFEDILEKEKELLFQTEKALSDIPGLRIIGPKNNRSNILSFVFDGLSCSDLSFVLTKQKIALRSGHHCCMPLMDKLGLRSGTVRASFSVYNHGKDVEILKKGILKAIEILS